MKWQPIETAPRDKAKFLVATEKGDVAVSWRLDNGGFYAGRDAFGDYAWTKISNDALAYWMPLPQPPKEKQ